MIHPSTLLILLPFSGGAFTLAPYSARGITQTLEPIATGGKGSAIRRDVNGNLVNLLNPLFQKYATTVECRDVEAPTLDGAWKGSTVQMACACELSYLTGGSPQRDFVPDSIRTVGGITYYRPMLTVMITDIKHSFEEWQHDYKWQLSAEEI